MTWQTGLIVAALLTLAVSVGGSTTKNTNPLPPLLLKKPTQ